MKPIKIFGEPIIDPAAIAQLQNCLLEDSIGVLTADAHKGYSMPVGGCIAYKNHISPSGVGFDIGCGNMAVKTDIQLDKERVSIPILMDQIAKRISFGMGVPNAERVDHPIIDEIKSADDEFISNMAQLAHNQLGTVGGGNHYVDIFSDESSFLWIGVHFGSRGFGHKVASGFISLHQGKEFTDKPSESSMEVSPILFDLLGSLGQSYKNYMELAGRYAYAGRNTVINKVLEILDAPIVLEEIHNHHNFSWQEEHFGEMYEVVRKGCTPAFPGQKGFIGANMMDDSVVVEGVDNQAAKDGLYSTVHGAGRVLSRTQAAGKQKWIRNERGRKVKTIVKPGLVDWNKVQDQMREKKIELRGAGADEAPECYKALASVLAYQQGTIKILHTLTPLGVCMAGAEVEDLYRD